MKVAADAVTWTAPSGPELGALVVAPADDRPYPGLLFFTDIFGRTPSSVRMMTRFAGYGYTVVAPDLYRRTEPTGVALDFVADYDRAQRDAAATDVTAFDEDRVLALAAMRRHPRIDASRLGCVGFCIGGHLALRASVEPDVLATVAYYPTGVHDGTLGASTGVDTIARLREMRRVLAILGTLDPHVPEVGRTRLVAAFEASQSAFRVDLVPGEHAFMRDEGPRHDPALTDDAFARGIAWLEEAFAIPGTERS